MFYNILAIIILSTSCTNVPAQMVVPHPERCWYVHTSDDQFGAKIINNLQQNYSPIILIKGKEYANKEIDQCNGFIYIEENPKVVLKSLNSYLDKNDGKRQNTKLLLIYSGGVDFFLEDSDLKYMHSKSLNVLMVRIHRKENITPSNILLFEYPFDNMSVTAPFINQTITITTKDVSPMKRLFKLQKWRPYFNPLLNITMRVGIMQNFSCAPFVLNGPNYKDGVEPRIIKEASKTWTVEFQEYISNGNSSVRDIADGSFKRGDVDLNTCAAGSHLSDTLDIADITHTYARTCATLIVPKPSPVNPSMYLVLPLSKYIWIGIALFSIVAFMSMYFIAVIGYKTHQSEWTSSPYQSLTTCMWNTFTILTSQGAAVPPNQNSLRVFIMAWILVCLLLGYCTGYASLLTYPRLTKKIETVEDIVEQDLYWGVASTMTNFIKQTLADYKHPLAPELLRRLKPECNDFDRFERFQKGRYAIFVLTFKNKYAAGTESLANISRSLEVLRECFAESSRCFRLQINSPYKHILDDKILQITESGIIDSWLTDISFKNNFSYMEDFFSHDVEANDVSPLTLHDLQGVFYLLCLGLMLSAFVFLYEKWNGKCGKVSKIQK